MLPAAYTWSLTAIAIAVALVMLWAVGRWSDQTAIRKAKGKIRANLLAFRLFADEPAQIFRAQGQLVVWNLRYLGLMLRPLAITIVPLALLLFYLDSWCGRRPLAAGEVTLARADLGSAPPALEEHGITIDSPAVRVPAEHVAYFRVRALRKVSGTFDSIKVDYPAARIFVFGFGVHWLVWFCVISLIAMLVFRRRFGVTF
jgi:hypothetical protein